MKEFILILCKPALLLCLLCITVLGCNAEFAPGDFPLNLTTKFTLKNTSNQEIHIFLEREGTGFDPSNKVEAGNYRIVFISLYFVDKDSFDEITVNAGRDGQVLKNKIYTMKLDGLKKLDKVITWDGNGLY